MPQDQSNYLRKLAELNNEKANKYLAGFSNDLDKQIRVSDDNDSIFEKLELLEHFYFRVPDTAIKIAAYIIKSKKVNKPNVKKVFKYTLEGRAHEALIDKALNILNNLRYYKTEVIFNLLVNINGYGEKRSQEIIKNIAEFEMNALKNIGFKAQELLLDTIENWGIQKRKKSIATILIVGKEILQPSYEGHTSENFETFTFHFGSLNVSQNLISLRLRMVHILEELYMAAKFSENISILDTLREVAQTPDRSKYTKDTEEMIINDANRLVEFYIKILPEAENEVIKAVEESKVHLVRRYGREKLLKIETLEKLIKENPSYDLYRSLVGYEGRLSEENSYDEVQRERKEKIASIINEIDASNLDEWATKLLAVASNYSKYRDHGEFHSFKELLNEFAKSKPELAAILIKKYESEFSPFLIDLLAGILVSADKIVAKELIIKWAKEGKYLESLAFVFSYANQMDTDILKIILDKAKNSGNTQALINVSISAIQNYPACHDVKSLFLEAIEALKEQNNYQWLASGWFRIAPIAESFTEKEYKIVVNNLSLSPRVDYEIEQILLPAARKYPQLVVDFFYRRNQIKAQKTNFHDYYDTVPFDLKVLAPELAKHPKIITIALLKWFKKRDLLAHDAGDLMAAVFPSNNKFLESELLRLVKKGDKKSLNTVLTILRSYKGSGFLPSVYKAIIKKYSLDKRYKAEIFSQLSELGVVSGWNGFADGYRNKKEAIQSWKNDKNKAVRSFAIEYDKWLDEMIVFEQKRAEEEKELRKLEFGE